MVAAFGAVRFAAEQAVLVDEHERRVPDDPDGAVVGVEHRGQVRPVAVGPCAQSSSGGVRGQPVDSMTTRHTLATKASR